MLVQWNFCSLFQDLQQFAREESHSAPAAELLWRCQVCYQGLRRGRKRC